MLHHVAIIATFLFIFICIALPWILNKIKNRRNNPPDSNISKDESMTVADQPVSFGYKCMWIAIKSTDTEHLIKTLNLTHIKPCGWRIGIEKAYDRFVFITPPIDKWTLACGYGLPPGDSMDGIEYVKEILKNLSQNNGEAQFFCTHRVTEYHCWIKAVDGNIVRVYSWLGEAGENILIEGEATPFEKSLHLADTFSQEAFEENYFDRKDITVPSEQTVMSIAENWSVDPSNLENRNDLAPSLGLLGQW